MIIWGTFLLLLNLYFQNELSLMCITGKEAFGKNAGRAGGSEGTANLWLAGGQVEAGGGKGKRLCGPYAWFDTARWH